MEELYPRQTDQCELVKARKETISFLLGYSKSLVISGHKGMHFENYLN